VDELVLALFDTAASGLLVLDIAGLGALEYVLFALGERLEDLGGEVKVLGNDGLGGVGCKERSVLVNQLLYRCKGIVDMGDLPSQSDSTKVDSSEK
jgi:hypothetical protein